MFRRDAGAVVRDVDTDLIVGFIDADGDFQFAAAAHGLDGVDEQVEQHLLKPALVQFHLGQVAGDLLGK